MSRGNRLREETKDEAPEEEDELKSFGAGCTNAMLGMNGWRRLVGRICESATVIE